MIKPNPKRKNIIKRLIYKINKWRYYKSWDIIEKYYDLYGEGKGEE